MKATILIALTFVSSLFFGQDYLDVECTQEGSELNIQIENHNISGPTRIKFNSEIKNLTGVDLKGGVLQEKKGQFVLIWMAIPREESFTIKLKASDVVDDILTIYYLVEGDRVIKEVQMAKSHLAAIDGAAGAEKVDPDNNKVANQVTSNEEDVSALTDADRDETMKVETVLGEDQAMESTEDSEIDQTMKSQGVDDERIEDSEIVDKTMYEEKREDTTMNGSQEEISIEDEDPKTYKVPQIYRELDINKNDEISADEINNAIDLFFDGEVDLSAADLNGLIDFFFEQD